MKFNRRRGVSPVIEALLVVGIAIAGVAGFIAYYYGVLGTATKQASVTVEDVALKVGTNGVTVSVTLKNAGTVDLSSQTATLIISGVTVPSPVPSVTVVPSAYSVSDTAGGPSYTFTSSLAAGSFAPGSTTGFVAAFSGLGGFTAGNTYPISINIGSVSLSTNVQASTV